MADAAVQAALKKEAAAGCAFFVFMPRTKKHADGTESSS